MMDIELLAVSKVMERTGWTDRLKLFININDKEPMWDGHIYVYEDDSKTNKSFKDKIPIQVKGKVVSKIGKKDKIKYPVETVDLNKYRDNGGIMYFVVYITRKDRKTTIFYASLLPFKINDLLDKKGEQQSISIELEELPDGDEKFESICFNFIKHREMQLNEIKGKNPTKEKLVENFKKDLVFSLVYSVLENEGYIYAENKDLNLTFPVEHIENIYGLFFVAPECSILVNGKTYRYRVLIENNKATKDEIIIEIGNSIEIIKNEKTKKGSFKFNIKGCLEDRIKDYEFLLDFIDDDKGMYIYGMNEACCMEQNQTLKLTKEALSKFNRDGIEKYIERLKVLKKSFG